MFSLGHGFAFLELSVWGVFGGEWDRSLGQHILYIEIDWDGKKGKEKLAMCIRRPDM